MSKITQKTIGDAQQLFSICFSTIKYSCLLNRAARTPPGLNKDHWSGIVRTMTTDDFRQGINRKRVTRGKRQHIATIFV